MQNPQVLFGIDHFLQQVDNFKNLHFALVTNNAATTSERILTRIALIKRGVKLKKLFSPEHGLAAQAEDGAYQSNIIDPITGLPVISLYGDHLAPSKKDIEDVDTVLFDIPDVGCRFYTYLWTMTYVMEACAEFNKSLIILDRPNPVSGDLNQAEGPMLDEAHCSSFIGRWSIPIRHSCTMGELALYFAANQIQNPDLKIIKVHNWKRDQSSKESGWFFTPPSPAIHDEMTALFYPGTGLFEGINVNEGRGTGFPFKIFGAPWINASQIHEAFRGLQLPGVSSQPYTYKPSSGLYADEYCYGLQLIVNDASVFRPVQTGLQLIHLIASLYPEDCDERIYKTRANPTGEKHLDKLTGIYHSFEKIKKGNISDPGQVSSAWKEIIQPHLLY